MCERDNSFDLNSYQKFLDVEHEIEKATSQLFELKATLRNICNQVQSFQNFDFVSISLVSIEQKIIESLVGTGVVEKWIDIAKHYLEEDKALRDIQADVYYTRNTEIISGYDKRFDSWIYERFNHENYIRVFTPILLIRDRDGILVENWQEQCDWQIESDRQEKNGQCISLKIVLPENLIISDVIGVIEAGYEKLETPITVEQATQLAKFIGQYNLKIYCTRLSNVLEVIAKSAVKIMQADCATLHFLYSEEQEKYIYQVCAGNIGHLYLEEKDFSPRQDGLGNLALNDGKPKWITRVPNIQNSEQLTFNPNCLQEGTRSYVAFPLKINREKYGVLYLHYQRDYDFRNEIKLGVFYAERAVNIIANAFRYKSERDRANQLNTLHSVAQSIVNPPENADLLRYIAWNILNVLAADVITIYEYIWAEQKFVQPPYIAGQLQAEDRMYYDVPNHSVPFQMIDKDEDVYLYSLNENSIFKDSKFSKREKIRSVACIKLKVSDIRVGIMFINYRRYHYFSPEEKQLIKTLAFSSALAIKNNRSLAAWLATSNDLERQIITTLDRNKLLKLIVERAVKITNADVGDILLLDKIDKKVSVATSHPDNLPYNRNYEHLDIGQGITGWVAKNRKSRIVNNVDEDEDYKRFYLEPIMNSELCVPIIYSDNTIIGVLNVESRNVNNFSNKHQLLLETLANQAAIALHNTATNKKLIATEKIATFGDLSGSLIHRLPKKLGAIKRYSQKILEESSHQIANDILNLADSIINEMSVWRNRVEEKPQSVFVVLEILEALDNIEFPKNIEIILNFSEKYLEVWGGKIQIRDIFANLIQNSKEAIEAKNTSLGTIKIDVGFFAKERSWIQITIKDNGVGIKPGSLEKIFENNYSTKDDKKGIKRGYGLWWTKIYLERLEGEIKAQNNEDEGAEFTIILPSHKVKS